MDGTSLFVKAAIANSMGKLLFLENNRRLDQHFEELDEDFFHWKERHHQWEKW